MKLVKLIGLSLLCIIALPLLLLSISLVDITMSLWRYLVSETTEEGDVHRESYNRAVNRLHDLVDTFIL